jgi:uncharacterized protein (TIGR03435 family)
MPDVSDMDLLRDYQRQGSEEAFAELVRRHVNLVYSAALRHAGIAAHAEEITQAVFVILARKAAGLRPDTILDAWLYETTRWTALSFLRGERRRQWREQEAYMQSTFRESTGDPVWHQLSPLLDEAMARLGKKEREAVVLRFFKEKSLREVAAVMQVTEAAAQSRVHRALEKLHRYFARRGVSSTTAIIAGAISANSVQAAPVTLAKAVSAVASVKGAASASTLTLIKGALKIMAWTKAKTAVVTGVVVLLAAGTTTITVKEIQEHRTYPWQVHQGLVTDDQLNQPPQVRILPSKFHTPDWATVNGKMIGTGVGAQNVVASAYGYITPARVVFSADLPANLYDYIACLPGGEEANEQALQAEVKRKFGVIGKIETRDADVWLLKVKFPNAPGLKRNTKTGDRGNSFSDIPSGFHGWNERMFDLAYSLEFRADVPVMDTTGLTNRFDFDLDCTESDLKNHDWDSVNLALGKLGLELVSTNMPLEMLVVEKVK